MRLGVAVVVSKAKRLCCCSFSPGEITTRVWVSHMQMSGKEEEEEKNKPSAPDIDGCDRWRTVRGQTTNNKQQQKKSSTKQTQFLLLFLHVAVEFFLFP